MTQKKKNIAIVCGGDSGEFDISIKSGKVVSESINSLKYNPYIVIIKGSEWVCALPSGTFVSIDKNDFSLTLNNDRVRFDAVFNALHGTPGEDGKLLGYFDILNIPYTSSDHVASALTFNKNFCKQIAQNALVKVANSFLIRKGDHYQSEQILGDLGLPVFVKPNNGGSSVGISKVNEASEFDDAVAKAFNEDHEVLVESFIKGREMACGVMESKKRMIVFPLTEIVSKHDFFDYDAKYLGFADEITPADIDESAEIEIKSAAARLYTLLGCRGFVRFDFILTEESVFFLEVNTVPGISPASILPQQAASMGMNLSTLFELAIENVI
ncbi:MAG: D-alanine--D-alanine ligase [Bacteroidetes bacterium HGW-Bacteroidetes-1]|jgi:D-alanine-D-alanine ligase|nr:MAG: D-alanine--D-alanine ligase [Bacteroidetes bacterium HGW-Bacteroidetes-1]